MAKTAQADFFERSRGFVASFNQILEEGFFETLSASIQCYEGVGARHIHIKGAGCLPDHQKWKQVGVVPFVDPAKVIQSIRRQLRTRGCSFDSYNCEVKTEDWYEYEEVDGEEKVVGKKGLKVTFSLSVFLRPQSWQKRD